MTTITTPLRSDIAPVSQQSPAANGLAMVRVTIGAMFVSVFFENLGKGLYTPAGYAGLINYYIKQSHSPAVWKAVMGMAASHAAMAAPHAGRHRDLTRSPAGHRPAHAPGRFRGLPVSRQPLGFGVGHRMDLGVAGSGARIAWRSQWDAQVEPGASTRCWHGGALHPRGGDQRTHVRVSVIIPTHNEAQAIGRVLADLPSDLVTEVIVVDSNSTDGTPDIARKHGSPSHPGTSPRIRARLFDGAGECAES